MSDEPGPSKKKKIYNFNREWEEQFLFTSVSEKAICLLCNASVAVPKRSNVERHHKSLHADFKGKYLCARHIISFYEFLIEF